MIEKRREFVRVRMGYRTVRGNDLDSLYRRKEGTQYFLFITNIVMLLVGLANFCVCIWIRSEDVHNPNKHFDGSCELLSKDVL